MNDDLSYKLGAIDSRLASMEHTLTEMKNSHSALWKKMDVHAQAITEMKTKQGLISMFIAMVVSVSISALGWMLRPN